jgi:hypothetical protein
VPIIPHAIYSNVEEDLQREQYIFEILWSKAVPPVLPIHILCMLQDLLQVMRVDMCRCSLVNYGVIFRPTGTCSGADTLLLAAAEDPLH